jgi:hypothetical protein
LCCQNYQDAITFSEAVVSGFNNITDMNGSYGFVRFATSATEITGLTSAMIVTEFLTNTSFSGGQTNTEQAIRFCTNVLDEGTTAKRILVLLTDGNPNVCSSNTIGPVMGCPCTSCINPSTTAANNAAAAARNKNYTVLPVGVGTSISESNLNNWGNGTFLTVDDFDELDSILDDLIDEVVCGDNNVVSV